MDTAEIQGKANVDSLVWAQADGVPWHGLGTPVPDALTAAEARERGGLDWTVRVEGLQTASGIPITLGRRSRAIVREDRNVVLGVTGRRYRPIQNAEAFDFMDALASEKTIAYHTIGSLGRGERVWLLAKLHGDITIPKTEDVIERYLLLANSHDGTAVARVLWTPVRVVCQNTLNTALRVKDESESGIRIRHTGNLDSKVAEAQRVLGLSLRAYDDLKGQIFATAKAKITPAQRKAYFDTLFGPKSRANNEDGTPEEVSTRTAKTLGRLEELFETGHGNNLKGIRGSVWAAYNAVTDLVDHERSTRITKDGDGNLNSVAEKRFESIVFGSGARLKEQAWELAKAAVGANN